MDPSFSVVFRSILNSLISNPRFSRTIFFFPGKKLPCISRRRIKNCLLSKQNVRDCRTITICTWYTLRFKYYWKKGYSTEEATRTKQSGFCNQHVANVVTASVLSQVLTKSVQALCRDKLAFFHKYSSRVFQRMLWQTSVLSQVLTKSVPAVCRDKRVFFSKYSPRVFQAYAVTN